MPNLGSDYVLCAHASFGKRGPMGGRAGLRLGVALPGNPEEFMEKAVYFIPRSGGDGRGAVDLDGGGRDEGRGGNVLVQEQTKTKYQPPKTS